LWKDRKITVSEPVVQDDASAINIIKVAQALTKSGENGRLVVVGRRENADAWNLRRGLGSNWPGQDRQRTVKQSPPIHDHLS
jgi:hypothetical protein